MKTKGTRRSVQEKQTKTIVPMFIQKRKQVNISGSSQGSSDFSQFELSPNHKIKPSKLKLFNKIKQSSDKIREDGLQQTQHKNGTLHGSVTDNQQNGNQQYNKQQLDNMISFKREQHQSSQSSEFEEPQFQQLNPIKHKKEGSECSEQLIKEYDKKQFYNHQEAKEREKKKQTLDRSRREQREEQFNEKGLHQSKGGMCFDVSLTDFVYKQVKKKKNHRKNKRKTVKGDVDIFSKEELLRRRREAFQYGQFVRRRTFHCY